MRFPPLLFLCLLVSGLTALGLEAGYKLVPLHDGLNAVDLNRDGTEDMVVVAHRENFNAHSVDVTSIYIWAPQFAGKLELQVVPLERTREEIAASSPERRSIDAGGGADCRLHDFRLFTREADKSVVLVTADREFGKTFADEQPVTFRYYKLTSNLEGSVGTPMLYFRQFDTVVSKTPFCDVNVAFKKELAIPPDGRSGEEAE